MEKVKAHWNDQLIAESDETVMVEGNHYFPRETVNADLLIESDTQTICPWKGTAHYYHLKVNGQINEDAAWYYPDPKHAALKIKDRLAFWKGVTVNT